MNETLSSSIWPNFQNSRPNWNEQFSTNAMNTWQNSNNNNSSVSNMEYYHQTSVDFTNVWSGKSASADLNNDDNDKDSYIKSIWSTSTSPNHGISVDSSNNISDNSAATVETPTNSPSMNNCSRNNRNNINCSSSADNSNNVIIVSNERWGNIKINQTTPWTISESEEQEDKRAAAMIDPMVWRARVDGTEVWEDYYTRQHGKRRPQQPAMGGDNSACYNNTAGNGGGNGGDNNLVWSSGMGMSGGESQAGAIGSNLLWSTTSKSCSSSISSSGGNDIITGAGAVNPCNAGGAGGGGGGGMLPQSDIFGPTNYYAGSSGGGNSIAAAAINSNHSNYGNNSMAANNNGVRPSMTRNQAQKYLQEMGFSLSDSIGALVNNQMDLPKALNELQSKYRMSTNSGNISNNMCNQSLSFNRNTDNVNIARIPPSGNAINPIVGGGGQNTSSITSIMNSNFPSNIDMFHSEISDQMLDSKYLMDQNMTAFNRMPESSRQQSLNMARQDSFRNNYNNGGITNRSMSTNSGHFCNSDINLINQSMSRMNFNNAPANLMNQNNSFNIRPNNNSSGYNGMHNINNNNNNNNNNNSNTNTNNNPNLMLNNNANNDVRQNFPGMPNMFGRSISKPPIFSMNNSAMNWHADPSVMSPNGAIPDMSQLRLAKNLSCPAIPDKVIAIVIKKVQHKHIDFIKSLCMESGAMINFQLNPQAQSIIVQFTNIQEAYRYINIIQNQLALRVEQINSQDEYMHYMSGAN